MEVSFGMLRPSPSAARTALGALLAFAAALAAVPAHAVGTRSFVLDTLDELKGGDLTGVAVDSNGNVRAGLTLGSIPLGDASSVWSSAVLPDGAVLLGTGNDGKILRVANGKADVVGTTGQMAVSALAIAWNGEAVAGTFPEGKLYKVNAGAGAKEAPATPLVELPGAEDVWGLAYDAKAKVLYAATGPEGKLFRVDANGKADVYFDSDEPHLVSVAVGEDGAVYVGSNGKGLLYKLTGPGKATVLHDFDGDDVKAIALGKDGAVYAISNKYSDAFAAPKRNKPGPPTPQASKPARPGKGVLARISKDGVVEKLYDDDDTHFVSLSLGDDGAPYVGTGSEGRVVTVDENHVARLVADTEERQVGALVMAGKHRFVATTDPAVFHEVKGLGGPDAVWTSKALDAGLRASFGRLAWRSEGPIELAARSGNTSTPDGTWSAWSPYQGAPGVPKAPPGRYVQLRARFARDPKAVLHDVSLAFVTDNARAIVTSIDAVPKGQSKPALKTGVAASGGDAPKPASAIKVTFKVDNPDQDELRYRVSYRLDGEATWHSAQKPGEKLSRPELEWDTSLLPEGLYRLQVEASDEPSNPPDRVTRHTLESGLVLVDNTPPVWKSLSLQGRQLKGEVVDGLGPIARIEVAVAGSDDWRPLFPRDGVFDEASEAIDANVSAIVPAGSQLVAVRAYDAAGNAVTRNVESK
jgi:hypothetical protein